MKKVIIAIIVLLIVGVGAYFLYDNFQRSAQEEESTDEVLNDEIEDTHEADIEDEVDIEEDLDVDEELVSVPRQGEMTIGVSAGGRDIKAYTIGEGSSSVLFVGGIHGGYSFNTSLLAYELIDYLSNNSDDIPHNLRVTVIPVLNPDGLAMVGINEPGPFLTSDITGGNEARVEGRFNANGVDLNRNFDCEWQTEAFWQDRGVNAGTSPFSEPEAKSIENFVNQFSPVAVVAWYAASGEVFPASCGSTLPSNATISLMNAYADSTPYTKSDTFEYYPITGDMMDWLAGQGIPSISVLLSDRESIEWENNVDGIKSVLNHLR